MATATGTFIVLYGINNIGKSTQAACLSARLTEEGYSTKQLKYPLYDLAPSGPLLNAYLREGNPYQLTPREAQTLYCLNRTQYDHELRSLLARGTTVVAEDYSGTSLGWGIATGVEQRYLEELNSALVPEDVAILLDGVPFGKDRESEHQFERDDALLMKTRSVFEQLAGERDWRVIDANRVLEVVHEEMWRIVRPLL